MYDEIFDQRLQTEDASEEGNTTGENPTLAPNVTRPAGGGRELTQSNRHAVYRGRLHEDSAS